MVRPLGIRPPTTLEVTRRINSKDLLCRCWICEDRTGHLELDVVSRVWYCHRHHQGGKFKKLPNLVGDALNSEERPKQVQETEIFTSAWEDEPSMRYLYSRGLTDKLIQKLSPCLRTGDSWRVYFPVSDDRGIVRAYVGRSRIRCKQRYMTVQLQRPAYPFWGVNHLNTKDIYIVEGIFDAVWSNDRLACLGHGLNARHMEVLRSLSPESLTLAFDHDVAEENYRCALWMAKIFLCPIWVIELPIGTDPGELRGKSLKKRRKRVV